MNFAGSWKIVQILEWVTTASKRDLKHFFDEPAYALTAEGDDYFQLIANEMITLKFNLTTDAQIATQLFTSSSSPEFALAITQLPSWKHEVSFETEEALCAALELPYIPPYLREKATTITQAREKALPEVIQLSDIKGLIHSHSNWSDGAHTIEEMALELINRGFEYLVISDHSKAAYYANGLNEQRIEEQHRYIDELNKKLSTF